MKRKKLVLVALTMLIALLFYSNCYATAGYSVYENSYNIDAALSFAEKNAYGYVNKSYRYYEYDPQKKVGGDCTNFVSHCIADDEAGNIPRGGVFNIDNGSWIDKVLCSSRPWTIASDLFDHLKKQGYECISFSKKEYKSMASSVHPGDVIIYDWERDGKLDHSAICVGYDEKGIPVIASHSEEAYNESFVYYSGSDYSINVVHMTNLESAVDVSSNFIGKKIKIKSLEVNQYISSNTSDKNAHNIDVVANRDTASSWEYFEVTEGDHGAVGFKSCGNNNYLSSRINENKSSAPIRSCAPNYQSYETFRIYEYNGVHYIQSQVNGKLLQVIANSDSHQLKAGGSFLGDWERFKISIV